MAKKISKQVDINRNNRPAPHIQAKAPVKSSGMSDVQKHLLAIAGVVLLVVLFLKVSLLNQFTNWDDPGYVINNPIIKDISFENIKNIFSPKNAVMGNYHPLTILTYAFDYNSVNLEPYRYHLVSLLFHLATTVLVYCFIWLFSRRMIVAIITAVLFGLHPMHIESVAWVAGRKDVVYGFFYMASAITYLFYIKGDSKKWIWYAGVFVLYSCSLLSKPVAVVLPVTLLLIDYFKDRIWLSAKNDAGQPLMSFNNVNYAVLIEKIPLFAMSVAAGIKSVQDQQVFKALGTQGETYNILERIGLGGYALITYLWKAVVPVKLLCFYPYPLKENGAMAPVYYIYPLLTIALLVFVWIRYRKNKAVVFGVMFFLVNIALLLQFIPVGGAIIADRYTYIPYIGLFFIMGWGVSALLESEKAAQIGKAVLAGVSVYVLVLGYMSYERCQVWYDGMSLWRDEIEVEPVRAPNGYNNLGFFYFNKFNSSVDPAERKIYYDSSYYLLNKAIQLQPSFVNPYISLGELMRANNQLDEAKKYYYKSLKIDSSDMAANAYLGLSVIYSISYSLTPKENAAQLNFFTDSAMFCYNKTLTLKPYNPEAHSNYANFLDMTGKKDAAIKEYGVAIAQNPDMFQSYLNRARALQRMNRCDEAFNDFNMALQKEPKMGEIYYARSICYNMKGDKARARKDVEQAMTLGFKNIDNAYYQGLKM